ncbi:MAG: DUF177 domain-containing protein [Bacteroidales bacterium]|nr:DUF177 domain-containing protein [Bacteroidales bacterium]
MDQEKDTTIQFSGLKSGRYTFDFVLDDDFFGKFENEEIGGGDVHFHVDLDRKERTLIFNFSFAGTLATTCDRCLGPMTVEVKGTDALCVRFSDTETSDQEDVAILPENAIEIDLAPYMYEMSAVRLPLQHIHADGQCDPTVAALLEQHQPSTATTDPRWDALLKLKNENK